MPSILKTKARRVLRYFNKYGFLGANLTLYIVKSYDIKNINLFKIILKKYGHWAKHLYCFHFQYDNLKLIFI